MNALNQLLRIYISEGLRGTIKSIIRYIDHRTRPIRWSLATFPQRRMGDGIVEKSINGSVMELDLSQHGLHRELAAHGIREKVSTLYYGAQLEGISLTTEPVVLDVGSNIGYFALLAAQCDSVSDIIAVEPDPRNVKILERNIEINGYENITVKRAACGAESGKSELILSTRSNLNRMVDISTDQSTGRNTVPTEVITIDSLIQEYDLAGESPIVLRMDVEGYETEVIRGADAFIKSDQPILIFLELHNDLMPISERRHFCDILEEGGFEVIRCTDGGGESHQPVCETWDEIRNSPRNLHLFAARR